MKNLIIHGHFYQPPRENPWTGIIEEQNEAFPFPNWNKKISRECYEASAYSPILNPQGKTRKFMNNYEHISFNMGPTLLDWLYQNEEHVYRKILDADVFSSRTLGEGNAIAQVYNHMILPLESPGDIQTQIYWGLENFQNHFKRDSKGLWLSETAINLESAREMIRSGIKYTILSPWQAAQFQNEGGQWKDAQAFQDELIMNSWNLECPEGNLRIFFYNPSLSSDISFNHLLRDADYFYSRVQKELNKDERQMLSVATDGEIYGHHEVLGNMGLSAFIEKVQSSEDCRMVNFSYLYENSEVAGSVQLKDPESGSSWSCSHGVSRWYTDCGCSTGSRDGWNQKWRTPLREAFRILAKTADTVFESAISRLSTSDAQEIKNQYIHVMDGQITKQDFFNTYTSGRKSLSDQDQFFRLLEGQKYKMFMFTSCAWFFADVSGTEARQNMMYAARLLELYIPFYTQNPETALLEQLARAQSNLQENANGAVVYTASKYKKRDEINTLAASWIIRHYYKIDDFPVSFYTGSVEADNDSGSSGILNLTHRMTGETHRISFRIEAQERLFSKLKLENGNNSLSYGPEDISRRDKEALMKQLCLMAIDDQMTVSLKYSGIISQLDEWMKLSLSEERELKKSVKALLHYALREVCFLMEGGNTEAWKCFADLMEKNKQWRIPLPEDLSLWLDRVLDKELLSRKQIRKSLKQDKSRLIQSLIPLLQARQGDGNNLSLSGRISELLYDTEEGYKLLNLEKEEVKQQILDFLNLCREPSSEHLPTPEA